MTYPHHDAQSRVAWRFSVIGRAAPTPAGHAHTVDMAEQQPYEVGERDPEFELRRYPSHAVAELFVHGSFGSAGSAGNQAFRVLFR